MKQRLRNIKRMHDVITRLKNKEAFNLWTAYIPGNPTEAELINLAEDVDEYDDIVTLFIRLVDVYGSDGVCVSKK